ncbi:MAG: YbhB/YbcL family Raf kinase inhibitor-like protein [Arenicellales bacterium]
MSKAPGIQCDGWKDGGDIPIVYTAAKEANIQPTGRLRPENRQPNFTFSNIPIGTHIIALVVHDVLDGEPVDGIRPGWTHYTALLTPEGDLLEEGETSETEKGWVGPYPVDSGEYHCTAYFLKEGFSLIPITRANILEMFQYYGLGTANMVGKYTNPLSELSDT